MRKFNFSEWLSSSGGPLVVVDESKAALWTGIDGQPSDYEIACQASDYVSTLTMHGSEVLVLGDEPLQTAIATSDDFLLIIRWKWADSEADVHAAIKKIDFDAVSYIEKLNIEWLDKQLVMFDAADAFNSRQCLRLKINSRKNEISTFIYEPTSTTALLIHVITSL
jgi:hypothetical protein